MEKEYNDLEDFENSIKDLDFTELIALSNVLTSEMLMVTKKRLLIQGLMKERLKVT